jgi:hypothetical protein
VFCVVMHYQWQLIDQLMKENGLNLWKLSYIWKEILNDELNWTKYKFLNLIQLNTIQLNLIQIQSKKNGMQIGGKGMEIKIYSWTLCCKEKLLEIYKYKKSLLIPTYIWKKSYEHQT